MTENRGKDTFGIVTGQGKRVGMTNANSLNLNENFTIPLVCRDQLLRLTGLCPLPKRQLLVFSFDSSKK